MVGDYCDYVCAMRILIIRTIRTDLFKQSMQKIYKNYFLFSVLHFDFKRTGISAALPFIGSILIKIVAGPLYDYAKCVSVKTNVIIIVSISCVRKNSCLKIFFRFF